MNISSYLTQVRMYAGLSQVKHKSYAPMVDALTSQLVASQNALGEDRTMSDEQIDAMRDREFNPLYRSYPLSRPTE